ADRQPGDARTVRRQDDTKLQLRAQRPGQPDAESHSVCATGCGQITDDQLHGGHPVPPAAAQSVYSTTPSSSTRRAFDPSGPAASVRNTARPGSVRHIEVVRVSPGKTGEVKRDAIAVTLVASPPP